MIEGILYLTYSIATATMSVAAVRVKGAIRRYSPAPPSSDLAEGTDLPSVTVCIPARNEEHALAACLDSVIRSNYEKLEIIVLDDNSIDNTPTLIKSFAHAGVRFAKSKPLPSDWSGRTYALQQLMQEASGSYILFMDVDARLGYNSLQNIVRHTLAKGSLMTSVIPRRNDGYRASVLFSTLRYFLEVAFSRRGAPGAPGVVWLAHRHSLDDSYGGFIQHKSDVQPEVAIAKHFDSKGKYSLLMSTAELGVGYEKRWRSQLSTAVRLFYPSLKSQTALAILSVLNLLIITSPVAVMIYLLFSGSVFTFLGGLSALLYVLFAAVYAIYLRAAWRTGWLLGALLWPVVFIQEAVLIVVSTVRYRLGTVTWKDRTIPKESQN